MKKISYSIIILLICLASCKKLIEKPSWNANVNAPLISTSLGLTNIIKDSSFRQNSDSSITIVDNNLLYSFGLDSIVKLSVAPYTKSVKLSSLKLDSQVIIKNISLGEIAKQLIASGNPTNVAIGSGINGSNGSFTCIPNISGISAGPFLVNLQQYFQTATLLTGKMTVTITNKLPFTLQNLDYDFKNKTSGTIIFADNIPSLAPNITDQDSVDLAGKTIEGQLNVKINNMDISAGCALIDTSKTIQIKIKIENLTVSSATAVFPTQDVIYDSSRVPLAGMNDVELTFARLNAGTVTIDAYSTAPDTIYFTYGIPSASKNGQPFVTNTKIPPAVGGVSSHATFQYDFAEYDLNLQGYNNDTINTLYNTIRGNIRYTGRTESFSLQDSVYVVISFNNIEPSYVKGYLGQNAMDIGPGSVSLDVFKQIESGTLDFEKVRATLVVKNGIGVDGEFVVNNITATNTRTNSSLSLSGAVVGSNNLIARATDIPAMKTFNPAVDSIQLGSGTNLNSLLSILPDRISYQGQVNYNPSGKPGSYSAYQDFAYQNSTLEPYLELEIPLSLISSNLILSDTLDFIGKDLEVELKDGNFSILVDNGFPLNANLKLYFINSFGTVLDSIVSPNTIAAATLTGPRVSKKSFSKLPFHLDQTKLNNVREAYGIIFKIRFSTAGLMGDYVKIYSDYGIDFRLVGGFDYQVK